MELPDPAASTNRGGAGAGSAPTTSASAATAARAKSPARRPKEPESTGGIVTPVTADRSSSSRQRGEKIGSLEAGDRKSGGRSWAEHRWHDLEANLYPLDEAEFDRDLPGLIRSSILTGHRPEQGLLTLDDTVLTMGSCLARELRKALSVAWLEPRASTCPRG